MAPETQAPWYFRQRFALFGAVYGVAFFGGYLIAGLLKVPAQPAILSFPQPYVAALFAAVCAVGGYALRVWASSFIAASIVWTQDVQLGELRVSGPYRFTRNPLYLGNVLQAIGIGLLGPWTVTVPLVMLMLAYCFVLISVEEGFLAAKNGAQYETYLAAVPRLVPLPWKHAGDGRQPSSLRSGLRSELMTGGFALGAVIAIAWVLQKSTAAA